MNSPIKWVGGKRREIKYFEKYIPNFEVYVEPFFGGGALFWHLKPNKSEINDINYDLINFYKVLKNNPEELYKSLQTHMLSKEYFSKMVCKLNNKDFDSDLERASIFYYLNKTSFSGKWRVNSKGEFNSSYGYYTKEYFKNIDLNCSNKLKNTIISNDDYDNILIKYKYDDSAFIFLDPPYLDCDTFYTETQEFKTIYLNIFKHMKNDKSKIMLIVKENDFINVLFKEFMKDKYIVNYTHNSKSNKKSHKHLIITNY